MSEADSFASMNWDAFLRQRDRSEAAEKRVAVLEAALEAVMSEAQAMDNQGGITASFGDTFAEIARAALVGGDDVNEERVRRFMKAPAGTPFPKYGLKKWWALGGDGE